jgi:hypothetical protein
MPFKDYETKLAYQRKWYADHRERVIAKVRKRRRAHYTGVCRNCGRKTFGDRPKKIPVYCARPACASVQRSLR